MPFQLFILRNKGGSPPKNTNFTANKNQRFLKARANKKQLEFSIRVAFYLKIFYLCAYAYTLTGVR